MHQVHNGNGFGLTVNTREDGTLQAAYLQLSATAIARTEEAITSVLLVDYDDAGLIVGIEILAPVKIAAVRELGKRMEDAHRKAFDDFLTRYTPPALLETA